MEPFTDYYALLGIDVDASPETIRAAFKKLALKYHPDVYKGDDAHERMRVLLRAYQTLNDPVERRRYDARRSEHITDKPGTQQDRNAGHAPEMRTSPPRSPSPAMEAKNGEVSPRARRDRHRYYDFPNFRDGQSLRVDLVDIAYTLPPEKAHALVEQGMLRGVAPEIVPYVYYCHRCHHRWDAEPSYPRIEQRKNLSQRCPKCRALDWYDYLLLRCQHCCAIFESEQIRYEAATYGRKDLSGLGVLCHPYELFPLCPYCGKAHWCPAEEIRVKELRQRAEVLKNWWRPWRWRE